MPDWNFAEAQLASARNVLLSGAKEGLPAKEVIVVGKAVALALGAIANAGTPGEPDWTYSSMFINPHKKVNGGRNPAGYLSINHTPRRKTGEVVSYPWYINIKNGTAVNRYQDGSGRTAISNFQKEQEAFINLSDQDFLTAMRRVVRFIELWEMGVALPQLKKAEEIRLSQRLDWMSRNK
jgi:hypothetical protein